MKPEERERLDTTMLELADECDFYARAVGSNPKNTLLKAAKALRASSGGSEPVAWGRMIDGKAATVSLAWTPANDEPLYASPLPGRDAQTIEVCAKVADEVAHGAATPSESISCAGVVQTLLAAALEDANDDLSRNVFQRAQDQVWRYHTSSDRCDQTNRSSLLARRLWQPKVGH